MSPLAFPSVSRRRLVLIFLLALVGGLHASEDATKVFDVPAGAAEKTLTLFSAQSGLPVLFPTEITKGIRTPAVQGRLPVGVALDRLLAGTGLTAIRDEKSGPFTVRKAPSPPHPTHATERADPAPSPSRPESSAAAYPSSTMKKPRTLITALASWLALSPSAQTNAAESTQTSPAKADETIALSPFEVRSDKDNGYIATNTLAGSRLNTRLMDTPASISVMTKDFLDDIGAIGVTKAMEYALSAGNDIGGGGSQVGASTGNGLIGNAYNFQIRGYRSATLTRNYFPTLLNADAFNIERIEVARGPNSLLFGIGGPGGIVNTTPKTADPNRTFGSVGLRIGSWANRRATIDLNQSLVQGKLAARVNLLDQEADGYHDFETDNQRRGALALTWRPTSSTTVRFDGELGHLHQNRVRPWGASEGYSKWAANGRRMFAFGTPESPAGNLANPPGTADQNYSQVYASTGSGAPDNGLNARADLDGILGAEQRTGNTGS
ncbi:MAG: hypothetical protein JWM88_404, partial [Verrucomicrobia bacterium]|nr:hypothetical protein [Verrucomicrobiota bacterium]